MAMVKYEVNVVLFEGSSLGEGKRKEKKFYVKADTPDEAATMIDEYLEGKIKSGFEDSFSYMVRNVYDYELKESAPVDVTDTLDKSKDKGFVDDKDDPKKFIKKVDKVK